MVEIKTEFREEKIKLVTKVGVSNTR